MRRFLAWITWRLWARGPWANTPPPDQGAYYQREKIGLRWSTPRVVVVERQGIRNVVVELLKVPKANRRWGPCLYRLRGDGASTP